MHDRSRVAEMEQRAKHDLEVVARYRRFLGFRLGRHNADVAYRFYFGNHPKETP